MKELPKGWAEGKIGIISERVTKGATPTSYGFKYQDSGIRFVKVENIKNGKIDHSSIRHFISKAANENQKRSILQDGDILFSIAGTIGASGLVTKHDLPANTNQALAIIRGTAHAFSPKFLMFQLSSQLSKKEIDKQARGGGMNNISLQDVSELIVSVPPLNEQRRIVAKLEKLLHKVDACKERLDKIPAVLKRFRQSVLAAACSGRLTADWREQNSNVGAIRRVAQTGRGIASPLQNTVEGDDLPEGWMWQVVEELLPKGGIFDGPFGSNLKSSDYTDSGVRVVRLENVGHLRFIGEKESFISRDKYETMKKHTVGKDDIIFASFIAEEIRACLLPKLATKAVAKADCFCLRPRAEIVDRQYLIFQLVSRESYDKLVDEVHGATRPRINTTQLRKLEVRMCPLPEQKEIVRRVETLFKKADEIEGRYKKAKAFVDKLTQSILAKAFRGELVPQDPKDEPASVLLERIKTERERAHKASPGRGGRKKRYNFRPDTLPMAAEKQAAYDRKAK